MHTIKPGLVHAGIVVDKVEMGQIFVWIYQFFHQCQILHTHSFINDSKNTFAVRSIIT
jgi:hypothetical protein